LVDDLRRGLQWLFSKFSIPEKETAKETNGISRSAFLSWAGMIAGSGLFGNLIYGFANKYRYQLVKQKLQFDNLPAAFKGLRVIQISDIHSGSFNNKKAVLKGVEKIMNEKPDLILFTGDLVNNVANEMDDYIEVFEKLQAQLGVYSILGNHDYGDYVHWENSEQKLPILKN
jgi:predicted MPP superfamily phosphohydrolase